jgi:HipA-like protein
MSSLNVFYEDILVGQLSQSEDLTYSFVYSQEWLTHENKFPLELGDAFASGALWQPHHFIIFRKLVA